MGTTVDKNVNVKSHHSQVITIYRNYEGLSISHSDNEPIVTTSNVSKNEHASKPELVEI